MRGLALPDSIGLVLGGMYDDDREVERTKATVVMTEHAGTKANLEYRIIYEVHAQPPFMSTNI